MEISKEENDRIEKTGEVKKAIKLHKVDVPCCGRCKHMVTDFDELCICANPVIYTEARGNLRIKPDMVCRLFEPKDFAVVKPPLRCGMLFNICPHKSRDGFCATEDACNMKRDLEGNPVPLAWQ